MTLATWGENARQNPRRAGHRTVSEFFAGSTAPQAACNALPSHRSAAGIALPDVRGVPLIWRSVVSLRRLFVTLYLLLFLAIGTAAAVYFWDARQEYDRLRRQESASRQRLAELETKLREQEKILERLRSDPVYVEKVIRRRLRYAKPDEFIFRFDD